MAAERGVQQGPVEGLLADCSRRVASRSGKTGAEAGAAVVRAGGGVKARGVSVIEVNFKRAVFLAAIVLAVVAFPVSSGTG